jgi:hypothetical protein
MALAPTLYDSQVAKVGDHLYAECDGQRFDGPLTRATL